jgi:hypothetical protein
MASSLTLRALRMSLDRFFRHEHDGKFHEPYCYWTEYSAGGRLIRCEENTSQVDDVFEGTFDIDDLEDEVALFHVPDTLWKRAFCDHHRKAYQDLRDARLKDVTYPASPASGKSRVFSGPETGYDRDGRLEHACHAYKLSNGDDGSPGAEWDEGSDNEEVLGEIRISQGREKRVEISGNGSLDVVDISTHGLEHSSPVVKSHNDGNMGCARVPSFNDLSSNGLRTPHKPAAMPSSDSASRRRDLHDHLGKSTEERVHVVAFRSLLADSSYEDDPEKNEPLVRYRIQSPLVFTEKNFWQEGFVYAFRDEALGLVKIGSTSKQIDERRKGIETKCKIRRGLTVIGSERVLAYKWLEKVIHQDLAPHRWFFKCECRKTKDNPKLTQHQEFFLIDDDAALRTLRFWASFVKEQHPWVRHPHTDPTFSPKAIELKAPWLEKLKAPHRVKAHEAHKDHDMRIERWCKLLGIVEPVDSEANLSKPLALRPVVPEGIATAAYTFTSPPPDSRASKWPIPSIKPSLEEYGSAHTPKRLLEALRGPDLGESNKVEAIRGTTHCAPSGRAIKPLSNRKSSSLIDTKALEAETSKSTLFPGQPSRLADSRPRSASALDNKSLFGTQSSSFNSAPFQFGDCRDVNLDQPIWFRTKLSDGHMPSDKDDAPTSPSPNGGRKPPPLKRPTTEAANDRNLGIHTNKSKVSCEEGNNEGHRPHSLQSSPRDQGATMDVSLTRNPEEAALSFETLLRSGITLTAKFLAKEIQPIPVRTVSTDLWQLRWPLACSIVFALQSPYMPPALSFVMWSVFLPFFVAELRAWTGEGQK